MDVIDYIPIERLKEERHWKLIVFLPFLIVFIVIVCLLIARENRLCHTKPCEKSSIQLHSYVDERNDPCDDFYDYACGTYFTKKRPHWGTFADTQWNKSLDRTNQLIRQPAEPDDARSVVLQKQFYQSCMNATQIEGHSDRIILKIFKELGGWPVLESSKWNERNFDVFELMIVARLKGDFFQWFLNVSAERDYDSRHQKEIIRIDVPVVPKVQLNDIPDYLVNITSIAIDLGAQKYQALHDMKQMILFENELHEMVEEVRRNNLEPSSVVTIENIRPVWPKIYWLMFLSNITQTTLTKDDAVVLVLGNYLQKLGSLLQKTDKRIQANYIFWRILLSYQDFISQSVRDKIPEAFKARRASRDVTCLRHTKQYFQHVAEADFARKYANDNQSRMVKDMLENICCATRKTIKECRWMDEETKEKALHKLGNVKYIVGGPKEIFDLEAFDQLFGYHRIKYYSSNIIEMVREVNRKLTDHSFDFTKKKLSKEKMAFIRGTSSVSAKFLVDSNTMYVPAGVFQPEFTGPHQQNYLNYGSLGVILAHTMVHGFGINGSRYTENNRITNWWSKHSKNKFFDTVKCLNRTGGKNEEELDEEFADFSAINIAFGAYHEWVVKNGYETSLKGFRYDDANQLFFTKYATLMCATKKYGNASVGEGEARVPEHYVMADREKLLRTYSNSKYFSDTFYCKPGTRMNPSDKCIVF